MNPSYCRRAPGASLSLRHGAFLAIFLSAAWPHAFQEPVTLADVDLANNMKDPVLQGQALDRVFSSGTLSIPAILEFVEKKGPNRLLLVFTQRLSEISDPKVEDLLVQLLQDPLFYWRPAAMWALADLAPRRHLEVFRQGLRDPLWGVRQAALLGLDALVDRDSGPAVRKLLADDIYAVRSQAAKTLTTFGDDSGLPVLVASLRDTTQWFDIDYGQIAREDAFNFLRRTTGMDFGFRAWEPSDRREAPAKQWEAWIGKKDPKWREQVPDAAWPKADPATYSFGFELRSCQFGDMFFRIDSENRIVLGSFNLVRSALAEEEARRIRASLAPLQGIDPYQTYGRSGCDFEKYYLRAEDGHFETPLFYLEGRPHKLDQAIETLAGVLERHFGASTRVEFEKRTRLFREGE